MGQIAKTPPFMGEFANIPLGRVCGGISLKEKWYCCKITQKLVF